MQCTLFVWLQLSAEYSVAGSRLITSPILQFAGEWDTTPVAMLLFVFDQNKVPLSYHLYWSIVVPNLSIPTFSTICMSFLCREYSLFSSSFLFFFCLGSPLPLQYIGYSVSGIAFLPPQYLVLLLSGFAPLPVLTLLLSRPIILPIDVLLTLRFPSNSTLLVFLCLTCPIFLYPILVLLVAWLPLSYPCPSCVWTPPTCQHHLCPCVWASLSLCHIPALLVSGLL